MLGGCSNVQKAEKKVLSTDYPNKPINFIVPFSAGGGNDLQSRTLEKMFPKYLNQNLLVLNKPGGGGTIGWNELVQAKPDGYTLGVTTSEIIMQVLYGETKYHYPTALEPLAQITSTPFILVVNADQPWDSLDDLIQYAKQNPGELKYGHAGIGAVDHLLGATFAREADIKIEQVPFQGGGEVLSALLGNHIQIDFSSPAVAKEQIKAGRVKALASTGEQRHPDPIFAQIPTFKELGFNEMTLTLWSSVAAPKELPEEIKEKLIIALQKMINDPEFKTNIENLGLQVDYLNAEQCKEKWVEESEKLTKMIRDTGIDNQIKAQKK